MDKATTTIKCPICPKIYTNKDSLRKHLSRNVCKIPDPQDLSQTNTINSLVKLVTEMRDEIQVIRSVQGDTQGKVDFIKQQVSQLPQSQITNNTQNNNQNLNVLCFGKDDDFLKILADKSTPQKALEFVRDCALSSADGDCRLLNRVYFPPGVKPAITYGNKSKTVFVYYDEKFNRVTEKNKNVIAKKIADNLQRCYLKGSLNLKDPDDKSVPLSKNDLPMYSYDRETLTKHVHSLQEGKYQVNLLRYLDIPFESDFIQQ
jgi:hypothetical protein